MTGRFISPSSSSSGGVIVDTTSSASNSGVNKSNTTTNDNQPRDPVTGRFMPMKNSSTPQQDDNLEQVTSKMQNLSINKSSKRNVDLQKECSDSYTGDYVTEASHYISVKEREYFKLPNKNDSEANYRNQNQLTNRSVHTTIDNYLLAQSPKHSVEATALKCSAGYISKDEIKQRIEMKIKVAKETGDINNKRYRNFLHKCAEAYGVDMRTFNG